jgi:hypothetical protein
VFTDVWSCGILAYEMWTYGELPYKGMTNQDVAAKVVDGFRLRPPSTCARPIFDVIARCWIGDYHARPTFPELVSAFKACLPEQVPKGMFVAHKRGVISRVDGNHSCHPVHEARPRRPGSLHDLVRAAIRYL